MKQNKLTKRDKILIYILKQNFYGYSFSLKDFSNVMVDLGYAATKNALNVAISDLVAGGSLERDPDSKEIFLTVSGNARARHLANYCMSQSEWAKIPVGLYFSKNDISKIDGTSSSKDLEAEIAKLKKENEELKNKLAEVESKNDKFNHMLDTIKDLEHTIVQLQNTIDYRGIIAENLRKSLNAVYSKLDNKTKAYDKIVDFLKKKLAAEQSMVNWTKNIIDGNAC